MIAFPEVQRKAQAELDAVVGRNRLPTFADAPHLPYLGAIIKEVLRWRPAVPLGIPHAAAEDDWYKDMFIPKVFGEDADEFRPERHLDEGELLSGHLKVGQAAHVAFGFGRRMCVGKEVALEALFITAARILWAAKLEHRKDENGRDIPLDTDTLVDEGIVVHPVPFDCVATPRFSEAVSILSEEREHFEN